MKKRFLLFAFLAITPIISCAQSTHAMTIDEEGKRWWTVDELIPVAQEINDTVENVCDHDYDCSWEETYKLTESDGKYRAADILNEIMMMLTEVKPSQNTFKVLFNNEDRMLKWMGETAKKQDLSRFLVVWKMQENEQNFQNFSDIIWRGEEFGDDWYQVYDINKDSTAIKPGAEIELTGLPTANLIENKSGIFYYTAVAGMSNAIGVLDYSSCLKSPKYQDGMGCKLKISEKAERVFEPYEIRETEEEKHVEENATENSETTNENIIVSEWSESKQSYTGPTTTNCAKKSLAVSVNNADSTNNENENISDENTSVKDDANNNTSVKDDANNKTSDIEIPNSGKISDKENNFPWWILVLIATCTAILIWLFWPKRKKESKKS